MGLEAIFSLLSRFSATEEWLVGQLKSAFQNPNLESNTELSARLETPTNNTGAQPEIGCYIQKTQAPIELKNLVHSHPDSSPQVGCYIQMHRVGCYEEIHTLLPAKPQAETPQVGCYIQMHQVGCYEQIHRLPSSEEISKLTDELVRSTRAPEVGCYIMHVVERPLPKSE
ncbi:MAG TPA: hypothetical protein VFW62_13350 [bacterium]|nr:hypothetical protein [bacterium]